MAQVIDARVRCGIINGCQFPNYASGCRSGRAVLAGRYAHLRARALGSRRSRDSARAAFGDRRRCPAAPGRPRARSVCGRPICTLGWGLLRGNLGDSFALNVPVTRALADAAPISMALGLASILLTFAIGVPLGLMQAIWRGRVADRLTTVATAAIFSAPTFWVALALVAFFTYGAASIGLPAGLRLPALGVRTPGVMLTGWADVADMARHAILPIITLAAVGAAGVARYARSSMIDVLARLCACREGAWCIAHTSSVAPCDRECDAFPCRALRTDASRSRRRVCICRVGVRVAWPWSAHAHRHCRARLPGRARSGHLVCSSGDRGQPRCRTRAAVARPTSAGTRVVNHVWRSLDRSARASLVALVALQPGHCSSRCWRLPIPSRSATSLRGNSCRHSREMTPARCTYLEPIASAAISLSGSCWPAASRSPSACLARCSPR